MCEDVDAVKPPPDLSLVSVEDLREELMRRFDHGGIALLSVAGDVPVTVTTWKGSEFATVGILNLLILQIQSPVLSKVSPGWGMLK
jgi:hypothetical protein